MAEMAFAEHKDMVETIPPDRTDEPLRISILPWRPCRARTIPYAHCSKTPDDDITVDAIPVAKRCIVVFAASRKIRSLEGKSTGHWGGVRSHPATEALGGNAAN